MVRYWLPRVKKSRDEASTTESIRRIFERPGCRVSGHSLSGAYPTGNGDRGDGPLRGGDLRKRHNAPERTDAIMQRTDFP